MLLAGAAVNQPGPAHIKLGRHQGRRLASAEEVGEGKLGYGSKQGAETEG